MTKFQRICLALFLIVALGPQAVLNIMSIQQLWHQSGLVYESELLGIRF